MKKSEGITNAIQSKPTHSVETTESGNKSSSDDIVLSTPQQDRMYHEERMSADAVSRTKFSAIKVVAILLIVAILCGVGVWWVVRNTKIQDDTDAKVEALIIQGKFDAARDEAKKLRSRGDTIKRSIELRIEAKRLLNKIDREEKAWNQKNYITIGRSSKNFVGMSYGDARDELKSRGFKKSNITLTQIVYSDLSKRQKKYTPGTVIEIIINDDKKFGSKEKFAPDSVIEIRYTGKE